MYSIIRDVPQFIVHCLIPLYPWIYCNHKDNYKRSSVRGKKIHPFYPIPSPQTGWTNWSIIEVHISKHNWRQSFPCYDILYPLLLYYQSYINFHIWPQDFPCYNFLNFFFQLFFYFLYTFIISCQKKINAKKIFMFTILSLEKIWFFYSCVLI